jgi:hypothetical protein
MDDCGPILEKMIALFADESKWTKKAYARAPSGECVEVFNPEASQWCLMGALVHACTYDMYRLSRTENLLKGVINRDPSRWNDWGLIHIDGEEFWSELIYWNDKKNRTFAEVKELLDEAIKKDKTI